MTHLRNPIKTPPLARPECFFIGGDWVEPSSGARIDVITPSTEELYISVAEAQAADIDRAVTAARGAFDHGPWPRLPHTERAGYLRAIGRLMYERRDELSRIWSNEMGAIQSVAAAVIAGVGGVYDYYAGLADSYRFEEPHTPAAGGAVGLLVREPVGVVAGHYPLEWPGAHHRL